MGKFGEMISDKANAAKTSTLTSAAKQFLGLDSTSLILEGTAKGVYVLKKGDGKGPLFDIANAIEDPEKAKENQNKLLESYKKGSRSKNTEKPEKPQEDKIILNAKKLSESENYLYDGSKGVDSLFYQFTGGYGFSSLIPSDSGNLFTVITDGLKSQNYGLQLGYSVRANDLTSNLNIGAEILTRMTNPGNVLAHYAQTGSAYRVSFSVSMPKINTHVYAKFTYPGSFAELGLGYEYRW